MIEGILWAVISGIMLGLYALPEKYTKEFGFENTWGMFFFVNLFLVPIIAGSLLVDGFWGILASIDTGIYLQMGIASVMWGIGVMLWGRAINHIGLSLGFSLFIGTVILVGSLLPFTVDGLPPTAIFLTILVGILIVLFGVLANGKAGILREQKAETSDSQTQRSKSSMTQGIIIAVAGGLLATGFSYANAAGRPLIHEACQAAGNADWLTAVVVMFVIYVAGGLFVAPYFIYQLTTKKLWSKFKTQFIGRNIGLTSIMAVLNFAASTGFAFSAFKLGSAGNTVGYAIFNTVCVAVAILSGLWTGEWKTASSKAKNFLYLGLAAMIIGVLVIAFGNGMNS